MIIEGRVFKFGDDINTDEIIPARYLNTIEADILARHCMEDARPGFASQIGKGEIIVAGNNFGCGSSREHAPLAIKHAGIACLIAVSFARIFYRNAINIGLPILEHAEAAAKISEGDRISVDLATGLITSASGEEFFASPFPDFMQEIIRKGGWIAYLQETGEL